MCFLPAPDRDETRLVKERDVSNVEIRKTVIHVIIYRAGQKVEHDKETDRQIPRRNLTKREKETHNKVKNRM